MAATPSDGHSGKARRPPDLWFTEQLESIAIAIAMALVLKFFVIEAYQIPSGSMQPTILGDRATGIKDRVLADKLVTMLRPPRRWEVMIFRFPNDERRLYVKRIVGLPGETLELRGGDVWIDGAIARKPDHVNESVLKAVFPEYDDGIDLGRAFTSLGQGIRVKGAQAVFAPDADGQLRLRHPVRAEWDHGYSPSWGIRPPPMTDETQAVADLDLAFDLTLDDGADGAQITLMSDDGDLVCLLARRGSDKSSLVNFVPAGGGPPRTYMESAQHAIPSGQTVRVTARNVDREILLEVDGAEWLRHPQDDLGPRPERPDEARVSMGIRGGGRIENVGLRRDIFYLPRREVNTASRWEVPDDSYFGLGDNTQSSLDSRSWQRRTYRWEDGPLSGFEFEHRGPNPPPDENPVDLGNGTVRFADSHGDSYVVPADTPYDLSPAPFIHERYLLGKVLAVFWPVYDPFRWKLVR